MSVAVENGTLKSDAGSPISASSQVSSAASLHKSVSQTSNQSAPPAKSAWGPAKNNAPPPATTNNKEKKVVNGNAAPTAAAAVEKPLPPTPAAAPAQQKPVAPKPLVPAPVPVKSAWQVPAKTPAVTSPFAGPLPGAQEEPKDLVPPQQPIMNGPPVPGQQQFQGQGFRQDRGDKQEKGPRQDFKKRGGYPPQHPYNQGMPFYQYQQPMYYGGPMGPPPQFMGYQGPPQMVPPPTNQPPAFVLPTSKTRTPIKIVNPANLQEIKLPSNPAVTIKAPAAAATTTAAAKSEEKTSEVVVEKKIVPEAAVAVPPETPTKKSAIVLKNPVTGEVFTPKSTTVTISKPPAPVAEAASVPEKVAQKPIVVEKVAPKPAVVEKVVPVAAAPKPVAVAQKPVVAEAPVAKAAVVEKAIPEKKVAAPVVAEKPPQPKASAPSSRVTSPPQETQPEVKKAPSVMVASTTSSTTTDKPLVSSPMSSEVPKSATSSKPPGFENAKPVRAASSLEEGEIADVIPILPHLENFDGPYPDDLQGYDLPQKENGVIKYSPLFFKKIAALVTSRPAEMASWKEIYGDEQVRPPPPRMSRQLSESGGGGGRGRGRGGSSRGSRGSQSNNSFNGKGSRGGQVPSRHGRKTAPPQPEVAPLVRSENAWNPRTIELSENDSILKGIKGILNKLTLDNFEKLSNKILESKVTNEECLVGLITLICEKAIDEPHFATVYAMLCSKLFTELPAYQEWICPSGVVAENIFRKLLLKRCQEEFEKDAKWAADDAAAQVERAELRKRIDTLSAEEKLRIAEEDYERSKLKRRVLGNIRFVGELFLQRLISESIIHRCIYSLLKSEEPEEEDVESLCKLITATGKQLDHPSAKDIIDSYFEKMGDLSNDEKKLSSRIRFMLMDVIDLRKNKWVNAKLSQSKSLAQVKKEIEMEEREKEREKERSKHNYGRGGRQMSKGGSQARHEDRRRNTNGEEEGWKSVGDQPQKQTEVTLRSGKTTIIKRSASNNTSADPRVPPPAAKLANSFEALEENTHSPGSNVPAEPAQSQMDVMIDAVKNYKESLDVKELSDDLENVDEEPVVQAFVKSLAQFLLDQNGRPALHVVKVFNRFFFKEEAAYSVENFIEAMKQFFVTLEDDRSDFPNAFSNISQALVPLFIEHSISFSQLIDLTLPIASYAGRKPALVDFLMDFLAVSESPFQFLIEQQFDIKPFFPENETIPAIQTWIQGKARMPKTSVKVKVISAVEDVHALAETLYANAEISFPESAYYRFVNRESDEIVQSETFTSQTFSAFLKAVTLSVIFSGSLENSPVAKSRELFLALKNQITYCKPVLDFMESPLDLLIATESFCASNSINNFLEDIFRVYYDLEAVAESVYFEFQESCTPESKSLLTGWFKYLKEQ